MPNHNINVINLEQDELRTRPNPPIDLNEKELIKWWRKWIEREIYLATLRFGGDWDKEFSWKG